MRCVDRLVTLAIFRTRGGAFAFDIGRKWNLADIIEHVADVPQSFESHPAVALFILGEDEGSELGWRTVRSNQSQQSSGRHAPTRAEQYAALGARVALCGRRAEPVAGLAEALREKGHEAMAASVDIRKPEEVEAFVRDVLARWGAVDILVNNAGGQFPSPAQNISPKGFEAVVRNNLLGTFNVTHAVANAAMIPQRFGVVINIIANVFRGFPGMAHTGAARAGVDNLTKSLAVEWAPTTSASTPSPRAPSARRAPTATPRSSS